MTHTMVKHTGIIVYNSVTKRNLGGRMAWLKLPIAVPYPLLLNMYKAYRKIDELYLKVGNPRFPKIYKPFQNCRRQKSDMQQIPCWAPIHIRRHHRRTGRARWSGARHLFTSGLKFGFRATYVNHRTTGRSDRRRETQFKHKFPKTEIWTFGKPLKSEI